MKIDSLLARILIPTATATALLSLIGCASIEIGDPNPEVSRAEVLALMDVQRKAWNVGDLEKFVSYYDASMTFCGSRGVTRGIDNLLANYQRSYPTAKERGTLAFKVLEVRPLGTESAMVLGEYKIEREEPASGFFTLLVQRTPEGLRIAHDHTSESPK